MSEINHTKDNDVSIDDDAELFELEKLLSMVDEDTVNTPKDSATNSNNIVPRLREDSTFVDAFSYEIDLPKEKLNIIESKTEELDSSDDEEVKNFLERKYNEYGSDVNKRLKQQRAAIHDAKVSREVATALRTTETAQNSSETKSFTSKEGHIKNPHTPLQRTSHISTSFKDVPVRSVGPTTKPIVQSTNTTNATPTFTDPVFGLRIINPLISSALLVERMAGRKAVHFAAIAFHTQRGDLSKDWVLAGVLINKSPVRTTKKGDPFSVWKLSDLRGDMKMVSLFLFKGAHKELWKTAEGMCLAILNPSIFEKRADSTDVACLSIDTAQKVMVLGKSKDLGTCRARKRNGDACTAIVNLTDCDVCVFHMKQEFGKMSRRSELQSASTGRGLNDLRNKVLGKSEVFYGGQSFTAVPAKKSAKLSAKDAQRLGSLSEYAVSPFASSINHASKSTSISNIPAIPYAAREGPISKVAANVEVTSKQRVKDLERLKILQAESERTSSTGCTDTFNGTATPAENGTINEKFKNRQFSFSSQAPKLSSENFCIEVNIGDNRLDVSKQKAIQILKKRPIEKSNPNSIRGSKEGKRRAIDDLNEKTQSNEVKRKKLDDEQKEAEHKSRIQRIIDATSSHTNLIDMREQEEQDKYFNKLEKKESLEEKMLNTYKIPCKAVICQQCKYTSFSAADRCKEERHPLKVVDAEKRFFQCKDCGNRTVTVFKLPKISCKNCHSSRWQRTAMIRERKVCDGSEGLSIRGDEETFIGSLAGTANLNLLVPDE